MLDDGTACVRRARPHTAQRAALRARARRLRRPDRAALLPRVPHAARRAPPAVRGLLARGALHPRRRCATCSASRCPSTPASARSRAAALAQAAGLRPRPRRGALHRLHAHARAPVQVRRPARCAHPVRALAGRGRARAAAGRRRDRAGAADPLAPAAAPVQPGGHAGPGACRGKPACRPIRICCGARAPPGARSA